MLCPCGSKQLYKDCCLAIINKEIPTDSPEQLMRSRYSAYAKSHQDNKKYAQYIYDTYAKSTQKSQSINDIANWAKQCQWLKLTIHNSSPLANLAAIESSLSEKHTTDPTVEFSALYLIGNKLNKMTEKSRFIREKPPTKENSATSYKGKVPPLKREEWHYLDGEVIEHAEIATIKRNDPCPCASNKKFKQCCGR